MRFVGAVVFEINIRAGGSRAWLARPPLKIALGAQHSHTKRQTWSALSNSRIPFHRQHPWNRLKNICEPRLCVQFDGFLGHFEVWLLWMKNGDHEDRAGALQRPGSIRDRRQRSSSWSSSSNIMMPITIFWCLSQYSYADLNILLLISIFWCWSQYSADLNILMLISTFWC